MTKKGLTETFAISIDPGLNSQVYTFTKVYTQIPIVDVDESIGKRVSSIVPTLTDVTITLLDTDGASTDGCVCIE